MRGDAIVRVMTETQMTPVRQVALAQPLLPAIAGSAAVAIAIYQVATPGTPTATFDSPLDWIREVLFLSYLLASIGSIRLAARSGLATRWPALLVSVGYGLISVGAAYGMVTREDPDWFFVLAGPGQLLAIVGFIWFAISGFRRRVLPGWAALLAGAGGTVAIIMAELGSSVLIGAFWLWVASQSRRP